MIIAIAAEEGGVGKSTLAVNLAVWRARQGRKVLLVDGERIQASASSWAVRRGEDDCSPRVTCAWFEGEQIGSQVKAVAALFDDVIIDGRSGNDKSLLDSLLVADCCLAPMRPNRFDLLSMVNMGKLVEQAKAVNPGLKALAVISQAPTTGRGADAQEVRELIQKAVPGYRLLDQVIHTREAWNQSINMGLGVMELTSDESAEAREELEAVATEIWDSGVSKNELATQVQFTSMDLEEKPWLDANPRIKIHFGLRIPEPLHKKFEYAANHTLGASMQSFALQALEEAVHKRLEELGKL